MSLDHRSITRKRQLLRELASDLADMVRNGDLTDDEANEWMVADGWWANLHRFDCLR